MLTNKISALIDGLINILSLVKIEKKFISQNLWIIQSVAIWFSSRLLILAGMLTAKLSIKGWNWYHLDLANIDWSIFYAWDSGWYQIIVDHGYHYVLNSSNTEESSIAFFPIYPLIIKLLGYCGVNFLIAGTLVSNIAFLLFIILFYRWIQKNYSPKIAYWSTICLAYNPVSLYGSVIYPESIFLLFSLLALQNYELFSQEIKCNLKNIKHHEIIKTKGYLAAIFGMLTTATRLNGIAIAATFFIDTLIDHLSTIKTINLAQINLFNQIKNYLTNIRKNFRQNFSVALQIPINKWIISLITTGGIAAYMMFCWLNFGNPWVFLLVQNAWRQGVQDTHWGAIWLYSFNVNFWGWRNFAAADIVDVTHPIGLIALIIFAGIWWYYRQKVGVNKASFWVVASVISLWQLTTDTGLTIALPLISTYLLWHYRHKIKRLHWLYSLFGLLVIYASGRTMSLQRFIFGSVTLPISFGILFSRYPCLGYALMTGSAILLFYNSMRWVEHLWVS
jgi:hypothetical protein